MAHIVNAFIAEALSVPIRPGHSSSVFNREADAKASVPAIAETILASGLFPLPPDPLGISTAGASTQPSRVPLNLASKLKLLGVVLGEHGGVSVIVEELSSKRQLFF
ncbi:MAG: hypothetical protein ABIR36_13290, partial [Nitrospiraceae bacterium]